MLVPAVVVLGALASLRRPPLRPYWPSDRERNMGVSISNGHNISSRSVTLLTRDRHTTE